MTTIISIHALRGEGDHSVVAISTMWVKISIHALRGEGDLHKRNGSSAVFCISIHALRGEGDLALLAAETKCVNFNPRPPWGGRRKSHLGKDEIEEFQSTPSVGRATGVDIKHAGEPTISIHALRGEGDKQRYI